MKLTEKQRDGAHVRRTYDTARTPFARLCASGVLPAEMRVRLEASLQALDPVRLLQQIGRLQEALWQHAVGGPLWPPASDPRIVPPLPFSVAACGMGDTAASPSGSVAGAVPLV